MSMRLNEVHPALAHFPVALLPTAVAADLLAHLRRDRALADVGRRLMPAAFATAAATGLAGFLAQGSVKADGKARDLLVTHRTLNIAGTLAMAALALWRGRQRMPSQGYLVSGLAGAALVTYTAYLGGKMVYTHGVGVEAAGGVEDGRSPSIGLDAGAGRAALEATARGLRQTAEDAAAGELTPHFSR